MDIVKGRSVRSGGNVLTTLSCSASGIFAICCDLTRPTITRLARTFRSTRTRRRREQYMLLAAFCLCHFSADFIICTCEFEFRQAHVFFAAQSSADCITNMSGFDLRQAQPLPTRIFVASLTQVTISLQAAP